MSNDPPLQAHPHLRWRVGQKLVYKDREHMVVGITMQQAALAQEHIDCATLEYNYCISEVMPPDIQYAVMPLKVDKATVMAHGAGWTPLFIVNEGPDCDLFTIPPATAPEAKPE